MSENETRLADERRPLASSHLEDAIAAMDRAIDAFGGWFPTDAECAHEVGRIGSAMGIIETMTQAARDASLRESQERLLRAILADETPASGGDPT